MAKKITNKKNSSLTGTNNDVISSLNDDELSELQLALEAYNDSFDPAERIEDADDFSDYLYN